MRQTRFKVWCVNNNEWEKDSCFLGPNGDVYHLLRDGTMMACKPDTHIVVFWTGLKDRNGKEIYEGDILRNGYGLVCPITVDGTHGYRFMFGKDQLTAYDGQSGEVIGNIYENQELMEEGKWEHHVNICPAIFATSQSLPETIK